MICPQCKSSAHVSLKTPDYGFGYGAEFSCSGCDIYGYRFTTQDRRLTAAESRAGLADSAAARSLSAANARKMSWR